MTTTTARRATAVVLGALAGGLVRLLAQLVHGDVLVPVGDATQPVSLWQVLAAALVAGLVGWALLATGERWVPALAAHWVAVAALATAASLAGPLGMPGIAAADRLWLAVTHVAVAVVTVPLIARTRAPRATRRPVAAPAPGAAAR
ncbi:DUF6069 family protein [Phycicoccus sonneratiae]|uniref:Uncharacterized protein n=1 Tax=Phycicoccus sonneratiae TaxID=2807628 RepID=A0ABS2CQC7_9MICO|nr:DUF6069 family protein [Phycicoccus sonneraticus]MBM6402092.1 hypothetical protein [Phycicoccus sonneraticus]